MIATGLLMLYFGFLTAYVLNMLGSIAYFFTKHPLGTLRFLIKNISLLVLAIALIAAAIFCFVPALAYVAISKLINLCKDESVDECEELAGITKETEVVHLVHGTFESGAPWTRPKSLLREAILKRSPGVVFSRFLWSGGNSEFARQEAVDELAKHIEGNPSYCQLIVAHSHGGNIVKDLSIKHPHVAPKIRGVALLSTPFILRKSIARSAKKFSTLHMFGLIFVIQIFLFTAWISLRQDLSIYYIPGLLGIVLALIIDLVIGKRVRNALSSELENKPKEGYVDFNNVELFHAIGDEADAALRISGILHELCMSTLGDLMSVNEQYRGNIRWTFLWTCIIYLGAASLAVLCTGEILSRFMQVLMVSFILLILWTLFIGKQKNTELSQLLVFAGTPVAIVGYLLNLIKSAAFGDLRYIFYPEAFVHSSETPVGSHHVYKVAPQEDQNLIHSTHSDAQVIMQVSSWVEGLRAERKSRRAEKD